MLLWRFETRDRDLLLRAFVTYVRTLMEYNCVVWSPDLKRDIEAIEKVQRRFTKRLTGLKKTILWTKIEISKLAQPWIKAPSNRFIVVL